MKRPIYFVRVSLLIALAGLTTAARASDDHERARERVAAGEIVSIETIVPNIPYKNARILEMELETKKGMLVYELELLTEDGVVRELKFDAKTGKLLTDEKD